MYLRQVSSWLVHLFTAFGAVLAVFAVQAIFNHDYIVAFWLMGLAIVIDAVDGTFARLFNVSQVIPRFDGALLDNIVDYINYVFVPACFVLHGPLLPESYRAVVAAVILLASGYQFCQVDAKTEDYFFKGFPSYWNLVVFYLFLWQLPGMWNFAIVLVLAILVFVPIKFIYPTRMNYLSANPVVKGGMLLATLMWGVATFGLLWYLPESDPILARISMAYLVLYAGFSLYRTLRPLSIKRV